MRRGSRRGSQTSRRRPIPALLRFASLIARNVRSVKGSYTSCSPFPSAMPNRVSSNQDQRKAHLSAPPREPLLFTVRTQRIFATERFTASRSACDSYCARALDVIRRLNTERGRRPLVDGIERPSGRSAGQSKIQGRRARALCPSSGEGAQTREDQSARHHRTGADGRNDSAASLPPSRSPQMAGTSSDRRFDARTVGLKARTPLQTRFGYVFAKKQEHNGLARH